ncbi:hypothetical protein AU193_00630 [Mycobacterium sp. GA-1285]|uniref:hypothetical protein n=1 Tax=Mycobacterium sp. GA-1285 TaxID=1772282 RepID=UPI000746F047|nr:hypothetical protein [Mycobacterium sp. GA-1285]KUI23302.1 hypothetical protein AU193_00630 [Mycobacterium sp. GA-1285]
MGRVDDPQRVDRHSVNRAIGILDDAVEHRALAFNPGTSVQARRETEKAPERQVHLTEADVCRLAEEPGRHADLVLTLAFTAVG